LKPSINQVSEDETTKEDPKVDDGHNNVLIEASIGSNMVPNEDHSSAAEPES